MDIRLTIDKFTQIAPCSDTCALRAALKFVGRPNDEARERVRGASPWRPPSDRVPATVPSHPCLSLNTFHSNPNRIFALVEKRTARDNLLTLGGRLLNCHYTSLTRDIAMRTDSTHSCHFYILLHRNVKYAPGINLSIESRFIARSLHAVCWYFGYDRSTNYSKWPPLCV